jgi:hypothetical protein
MSRLRTLGQHAVNASVEVVTGALPQVGETGRFRKAAMRLKHYEQHHRDHRLPSPHHLRSVKHNKPACSRRREHVGLTDHTTSVTGGGITSATPSPGVRRGPDEMMRERPAKTSLSAPVLTLVLCFVQSQLTNRAFVEWSLHAGDSEAVRLR